MAQPGSPRRLARRAWHLALGLALSAAHAIPLRAKPVTAFEVNATKDPSAVYSTACVAINPTDPRHVVAGANTIRMAAPMAVLTSRDRGATFTLSFLPSTLGGVTHTSAYAPSVAFSRTGAAFYAYMLGRTAFDPHRPVVAALPAGSSAWEGPYAVTPDALDDDKPYLTVDAAGSSPYSGRVYVAWDRNAADGTQSILLARSADGRTWQPPVRVDDAGSSGSAIYAAPATGPAGEVYVVWNDYAEANAGYLRLDRSLDGGQTFGPDRVVTDLRLNLQPDPGDPYSVYSLSLIHI